MKSLFLIISITCFSFFATAQSNPFHTLNMPSTSPHVIESQKLGVTKITLDYHSPTLRCREVWKEVIPMNGDPIPWRAGANMNTTIEFSTDVMINDQVLAKGKYGFHIIPGSNGQHTLLFAHANNQWGSYYLDLDKDISLKVEVEDIACAKSENLDYEFLNRTENSVDVALQWDERSIPFTVSVDLNKTVVESLRSELRGLNTYHWQAWNDAANWCYNQDTNLEEAWEWAKHSINGGYGGFAADKNVTNLLTKARLEVKLGKTEELLKTSKELMEIDKTQGDANAISIFYLRSGGYDRALEILDVSLEQYPEAWFLYLNQSIAYYYKKDNTAMKASMAKAQELVPDNFKSRLTSIEKQLSDGTYKI